MPNITHSSDRAARLSLLFSRPWLFLLGAPSAAALPPPGPAEIAFAGRSNVGKSSLINALLSRKDLARTSNTPGRTQELNFFAPEGPGESPPVVIVDMPGYGYARAPRARVKAWTGAINDYLAGRSTLKRVFLLIDARHGIKQADEAVMALLDATAVVYQCVLTKTDKIRPAEAEHLSGAITERLRKRPAAHPVVLATSARSGAGLDEMRAEIASLAAID